MDVGLLEAVKTFEGFTPQAVWDYKQSTNGYGTRATHNTETITKVEAERRLVNELQQAMTAVEKFAPTLDQGTKHALASLTFNAGTAWMKSGLGQAILRQDFDEARSLFLQYTKAGGKDLPGLIARRHAEVQWFGAVQHAAATQTVASTWQPGAAQPTEPKSLSPVPSQAVARDAAPPQLSRSVLEYLALFELEMPSILEHTHEKDTERKPNTVVEA
ncbi:MAG: lysozyme [Hyphomicrobiaceae bacterium]